jgi:AbrB family looped-hinge helix DNA binding protein
MTQAATKVGRAFEVRLGDRGRLVLPAELRRAAQLEEGDVLSLTLERDGVRLRSRAQAARAGRGMFAHLAPERDLVAELIAERRADAKREDAGG